MADGGGGGGGNVLYFGKGGGIVREGECPREYVQGKCPDPVTEYVQAETVNSGHGVIIRLHGSGNDEL